MLGSAVTSVCWYLTVQSRNTLVPTRPCVRTQVAKRGSSAHAFRSTRGRTFHAAPPPRGPTESCPAGSGPGPRRAAFWNARHVTVRHAAAGRHRPYLIVPKLGWDCRHVADAGQVRHSNLGILNQAKVTGAGCSPPTGGTAPRLPVRRSAPFRTWRPRRSPAGCPPPGAPIHQTLLPPFPAGCS